MEKRFCNEKFMRSRLSYATFRQKVYAQCVLEGKYYTFYML